MRKLTSFLVFIALLSTSLCFAQFTPHHQWTFLPESIMDEIIGEASGEAAMNNMIEMGAYNHDRLEKEFTTTLFETQYVYDKLIEYGLEEPKIERFESSRKSWDGIKGTLWETSPNRIKHADYRDLTAHLASGSVNTDIVAELIWIGDGSESFIKDLDLKGKIAVTNSHLYRIHDRLVKKGAVGFVSFYSSRPIIDPLQIPISGIYSKNPTFAFFLSQREGSALRDRLKNDEIIKVHALVEAKMQDTDMQIPTAIIKGADENADEIIFSAHLFEGYTKQGANDNISGSVVILEIANILNKMINDGRIDRPKRTIRFIWVPEYSGTGAWVKEHQEITDKTLCNINYDMVGIRLDESNSSFNLMRTTFGNPHYINDVMEHYLRFVGETNREMISSRSHSKYLKRIVAPSGTDEPFRYIIEAHYGASDHEVFNDWGVQVPGIMMITWPDMYYHSSHDRPEYCDPTQLKRATVIGAAAAYTIVNADNKMAKSIAGEVFGNSAKRIGYQLTRGIDLIQNSNKETFESNAKKATAFIDASVINEKETIASILELTTKDKESQDFLLKLKSSVDICGNTLAKVLNDFIEDKALELEISSNFKMTPLEKEAVLIFPTQTKKVKELNYRGYSSAIRNAPEEILKKHPFKNIADSRELARLSNGSHNALEIKKILDTQKNRETQLQDIINYLNVLKAVGLVSF